MLLRRLMPALLAAGLLGLITLATTDHPKSVAVINPCPLGTVPLLQGEFCTHGNDPLPRTPSTAECRVSLIVYWCQGYLGLTPPPSPTPQPRPGPEPLCGTSGPRIQALYLRQSNQPDRYSERLSGIVQAAKDANSLLMQSAQKEGRTARLRYLTDSHCTPVVAKVTTTRTLASFSDEIEAVRDQGFSRTDYSYLIFPDRDGGCGVGTADGDSQPDPTKNVSNNTTGYAAVYPACLGGHPVLHELAHTMGAVQLDAPHSTGGWHCNDGPEAMCYQDGSPQGTQHQACDSTWADLLDCGRDDYFAFTPRGSYLPSHWNLTRSRWMEVA